MKKPNLLIVHTCGREEGRDGSAFLRGEEAEWDDVAHLHHSSHTRAGIFTCEYELALLEDGEGILFDRINDPDQVNNLYADPAYAAVAKDLTERVVAHQSNLQTPAVKWLSEAL